MLTTGCASGGKSNVILTNSQFKCVDKPIVPENSGMINDSGELVLSKQEQVIFGGYIVDIETAYDLCQARLLEIRDVIQVQGGTITDVLVTGRKKILGLF